SFLAFKQVYHQSFINIRETKKQGKNKGNPLIALALDFREAQVQKFKQYIPYKNSQSVASTLILGYRAELDQQIIDAYQKTGTLHILSVSGMHVAIVVLLLNCIFKPLDKYRYGKTAKLISMLLLIWFYSVITGLAPSILRAALMLSFMLVAKRLSAKANIYNVVAISAFIILLIDPFSLMDIGFQLSFLAVLGLVYIHPKIYNLYRPKYKLLDLAWQCASISIAAQIATTPISLFYFHQFPIYFIVSNLFMALPAAIIMYVGIAFLCFFFYPPLMEVLGYILNHLIDLTNIGLIYIEHFPYATLSNIWFSKTEILLLYAALFSLFFIREFTKRAIWLSIFMLSFVSINSYNFFNHVKQHKTTFFSLRKNTAVAYISGRNALLITDLESSEYTYRFSVKPFLDSCRIVNIKHINPHEQEGEKLYHFANKKLRIINHKQDQFSSVPSDWILL
ncbi:ComEC/Rec2 family competence protein, partial [Pseudoxanthomonas sp. SGD-10]